MKKDFSLTIYILTLILLILIVCLEVTFIKPGDSVETNSTPFKEPDTPVNIDDPTFYTTPLPENEVPIQTVLEKGDEIPIEFIYNDPNWIRPIYKDYWNNVRWNNVPNLLYHAMHRIFVTYATASIYYDFIHELGISDESKNFSTYESDSPYDYLQVVIMNTSASKIITYENQILIIGKPERTGLQALIIPTNKIQPIKIDNTILIQLITQNGDELDYTTIPLAKPPVNQTIANAPRDLFHNAKISNHQDNAPRIAIL